MSRVYAIEPKEGEFDGNDIASIEYPLGPSPFDEHQLIQRIELDEDADEGWATVYSIDATPRGYSQVKTGEIPELISNRVYVKLLVNDSVIVG